MRRLESFIIYPIQGVSQSLHLIQYEEMICVDVNGGGGGSGVKFHYILNDNLPSINAEILFLAHYQKHVDLENFFFVKEVTFQDLKTFIFMRINRQQ